MTKSAKSKASAGVHADLRGGYKPSIAIEILTSEGRRRTVHCLVDTGGGAGFQVSAALAKELVLSNGDHVSAFVGDQEVDVADLPVVVIDSLGENDTQIEPNTLMRYRCIFDFPGGVLELEPPDSGRPSGERLDAPFVDGIGFPRIEVEVDQQSLGLLLDTGAMFTMFSEVQIKRWRDKNPGWRNEVGARGDAAMGIPGEVASSMLWIPELRWGSFIFNDVGVVGRPEGTFEQYMSKWMPAPIVGALGNSVLRHLRVEIDYRERAAYVTRPPDRV